jgi:type IV pilus assembly protein PilE
MNRTAKGFTLIELMVTVAVVGILTAIALPSYSAYVTRGRLAEAFGALGGVQLSAEQFWNNNRTYVGMDAAGAGRMPANTTKFSYTLTTSTATTYVVTATGAGPVNGWVFTIDQSGARATTGVPTTGGWTANSACWVDRKGGLCTQ